MKKDKNLNKNGDEDPNSNNRRSGSSMSNFGYLIDSDNRNDLLGPSNDGNSSNHNERGASASVERSSPVSDELVIIQYGRMYSLVITPENPEERKYTYVFRIADASCGPFVLNITRLERELKQNTHPKYCDTKRWKICGRRIPGAYTAQELVDEIIKMPHTINQSESATSKAGHVPNDSSSHLASLTYSTTLSIQPSKKEPNTTDNRQCFKIKIAGSRSHQSSNHSFSWIYDFLTAITLRERNISQQSTRSKVLVTRPKSNQSLIPRPASPYSTSIYPSVTRPQENQSNRNSHRLTSSTISSQSSAYSSSSFSTPHINSRNNNSHRGRSRLPLLRGRRRPTFDNEKSKEPTNRNRP